MYLHLIAFGSVILKGDGRATAIEGEIATFYFFVSFKWSREFRTLVVANIDVMADIAATWKLASDQAHR